MASKKKWNPTGLSSDWKLFGNWNVKVLDSNNRWQLLHQVSALSMTAKATVAGETDVVVLKVSTSSQRKDELPFALRVSKLNFSKLDNPSRTKISGTKKLDATGLARNFL